MPMNKPTKLTLAAAAPAALVLAAVAGAASRGHEPLARRLLDAEDRDGEDHPGLADRRPTAAACRSASRYGASTNQAKAVAAGQPADLVFLSTGDDVNLLVDAGLVNSNWNQQSYDGIAADTVVVFAVRNGNPKHIKGWADLIKPGVQVVTPNPFSSGSAKWNILAAYGAERRLGKTDKQATAYVQQLFTHVVSQDTSGSNATNTFLSGKGDVLITYESEAINAALQGKHIQYVIPRQTMLIELPVAVLKKSSNMDKREQVHPLRQGRRRRRSSSRSTASAPSTRRSPRKRRSKEFPARPGIFKIDDKYIGGWRNADKVWFDPKNGRMVKIEQAVGGPSSG